MLLLKEKYIKEVLPALKEKFGYKNNLAVPKIVKAVVNVGFNPATGGDKIQEDLTRDLTVITGQKPSACQVKNQKLVLKPERAWLMD